MAYMMPDLPELQKVRYPTRKILGGTTSPVLGGSGPTAPPTGPTPPPTPGPTPLPRAPGFGDLLDKLTPAGANPTKPPVIGTPPIPKANEPNVTGGSLGAILERYTGLPDTGVTFTPAAPAVPVVAGGKLAGPGAPEVSIDSAPEAVPVTAGGNLVGPGNTLKPETSTYTPPPNYQYDTPLGEAALKAIEDRLAGRDAGATNMLNRLDTDSSRRRYLARTSAEEAAGQAGVSAGTSRYSRMMDRAMSPVYAADQAQRRDVTDYIQGREDKAIGDAVAADERAYGRRITDRTYGDTKDLLEKQEIEALINSAPNSKVKNFLRRVQVQGGDVRAAYANAVGETGAVNAGYQERSPVGDIRAEAEEWVDLVGPGVDASGKPLTREQAVVLRMQQLDAAKRTPLQKGAEDANLDAIIKKMNSLGAGQLLDATDFKALESAGRLPRYAVSSVPKGTADVQNFLLRNPGGIISLDGKQFRVLDGGSFGDVESKYIHLVGEGGVEYWLDQQGKWYNQKPQGLSPSRPKNSEIPSPI